METKERLEYIEKFKEQIEKENNSNLDYKKLEENFHIENYFLTTNMPYLESKFYETLMEMCLNVLKNIIQEIDYYINVKATNPVTSSDFEILSKETKINSKFYYKFHIIYKKYHKLYFEKKQNTKESINYISEALDLIEEFKEHSISLQSKFIENLNKKIQEFEKENKKIKFESSIYS